MASKFGKVKPPKRPAASSKKSGAGGFSKPASGYKRLSVGKKGGGLKMSTTKGGQHVIATGGIKKAVR